jgi:hypothetical protein
VLEPKPAGVAVSSSMPDYIESLEVEHMFWRRCIMCPIAVDGVIFKCLLIACSGRSGQVMIWLFFTACRKSDVVGLKISLCK